MALWCQICLTSFCNQNAFDRHMGNGNFVVSRNHKKRLEEVNEARIIWNQFHSDKGPMPIGPLKEETIDEARRGNPKILEIIPPGQEVRGPTGTGPCPVSACHGTLNIHWRGEKKHKVFEDVAYKINAKAHCKTKKFNYVLSCVAHKLFRYDGKYFGKGITSYLASYVRDRLGMIEKIKTLLNLKFNGEDWTQEQLVEFISFFRRRENFTTEKVYMYIYGKDKPEEKDELEKFDKDVKNFEKEIPYLASLKVSDAHLHFCCRDCNPLFLRMDVVQSYETNEESNECEKNQISTSGSYNYATGGHNNVDKANRMQNRDLRPPTAFYMFAPLDNMGNLTTWMAENGIEENHNYPSNYIFTEKSISSSSSPAVYDEDILEAKIRVVLEVMTDHDYSEESLDEHDRQKAIMIIDNLRKVDETFSSKKPRLN